MMDGAIALQTDHSESPANKYLTIKYKFMNPNLTEIGFVLDRSGSMESMRLEAQNGFTPSWKRNKNFPEKPD